MTAKALLHAGVAILALSVGLQTAAAQQQPTRSSAPAASDTTAAASRTMARECLNGLRAFNERMDKDGFWLAGWGSGSYGAETAEGRTAPMNRPANATAPTTRAERERAVDAGRAPWSQAHGWGIASPPYQIRTLHAAVNVLGHRGDEPACQQVLAELREAYGSYAGQLKQAGVEPGQVTSWRRERIIASRPVTELNPGLVNLGKVTGTEVRNLQDEELGTVEDVVLNPQSGEIHYVIVSSGGILGLGEDMVPVPWSTLRATPGMNTFVLDATEQVVEDAPAVDTNRFANPSQSADDRKKVDQYWRGHTRG